MIQVQTPDERLAALKKPAVETIKKLALNSEDCLVVCAGFEDRALGFLRTATSFKTPFNVLAIQYLPLLKENKSLEIRKISNQADLILDEVTYDREDPAGFGVLFLERIHAVRGRTIIDISGMSRLLIVQLLVALSYRDQGFRDCFVAYAEAQKYSPNQEETEAMLAKYDLDPAFSILFLSSGVFDVTVVSELSSSAPSSGQTRLIVFPTLDADQMTALRAELQPSRYTVIEGIPPNPRNKWRIGAIAAINRLEEMPNTERMKASTLDYVETLNCLLSVYREHGIRDRLLISPTGSKMQAVAVGLFKACVNDVQIVYPTPRGFLFPDSYTSGVGALHFLSLTPFTRNGNAS